MWKQAEDLARQYQLVVSREPGVGFLGRTVEMPLVMADGKTIDRCAAETIEATALAISAMLERGERPPSPAGDEKREVQLNVRLTALERLALENAARREGYRSVSDFVRAAALGRSRVA